MRKYITLEKRGNEKARDGEKEVWNTRIKKSFLL